MGKTIRINYKNVFVKRIIDGDSFRVVLPDMPELFGKDIPVRVRGVDCPELRSSDPAVRAAAVAAKEFTKSFFAKTGFVDVM